MNQALVMYLSTQNQSKYIIKKKAHCRKNIKN